MWYMCCVMLRVFYFENGPDFQRVSVFAGWHLCYEWFTFSLPRLFNPRSLLPVPQLPGAHVGQWHRPPGPGLPEDAEDQPHALHRRPVSRLFFCLHCLLLFCLIMRRRNTCPWVYKGSNDKPFPLSCFTKQNGRKNSLFFWLIFI